MKDNSEEFVLIRLERATFNNCDDESIANHLRYAVRREDIRSLAHMAEDEMKKGNYEHVGILLNHI